MEPADVAGRVREGDPDRYLSVLYAPEAKRPALLSLYAFALEIGSVRERVREPMAGEIRLQWWRDVLTGGQGQGSPVAEALLETMGRHGLPAGALERMIDARVFDLYDDPMPSRGDLEGYCGDTASALIQLSGMVLDPQAARRAPEAAGHAGCAQAIAGLARSLAIHGRRGQCFLPLDLLSAAGTDREGFLAGEGGDGRARALAALVALGQHHAARFAELARGLPASLRPAFLPAALAPAYLRGVEKAGAGVFERVADISPVRRHWIMLRHALRGWG